MNAAQSMYLMAQKGARYEDKQAAKGHPLARIYKEF